MHSGSLNAKGLVPDITEFPQALWNKFFFYIIGDNSRKSCIFASKK